jgi:phosphatidate phosphatase APP1
VASREDLRRWAASIERRWDGYRLARRLDRPPRNLRIVAYRGHGSASTAVVRGRVLDDPEPSLATPGEGVIPAIRRTVARFNTNELPGVPLYVRVGDGHVDLESDDEGYFDVRLDTSLSPTAGGWVTGEVGLRHPYRDVTEDYVTPVELRVPGPDAAFGVISDIDDTILHTGAQRIVTALRRTMLGSALTRASFAGTAELYRGLAAGRSGPDTNPVFYISSSPWNLYGFLVRFLEYRRFPAGAMLLRDLLGGEQEHSHHSHKDPRIHEVLEIHRDLDFVLIGDSGQEDPAIYAEAVRRHPGRIRAVFIREVRLDPGDGRVEKVADSLDGEVPFVLAADSAVVADHAAALGLIDASQADAVRRAVGS